MIKKHFRGFYFWRNSVWIQKSHSLLSFLKKTWCRKINSFFIQNFSYSKSFFSFLKKNLWIHFFYKIESEFWQILHYGDGNFAPSRLTRPSPLYLARIFPTPQRWWGKDGVRFWHRTMGRGGDGFILFSPTLSRVVKGYNCKFFIS